MKKIWYFIIFGSLAIILLMANILSIIFFDLSWWYILISIGLILVAGVIIGIIFLVLKLKTKVPKLKTPDVKKIKERMVNEIKMDEDNPDNFKIETTRILNVGESGKQKTKVLWCRGLGTETGGIINTICDMSKPKETFRSDGASEESMIESIRTFAENPEDKIIEERKMGYDEFGRATPIIKITKGKESPEEKEKEKEKELKGAL